VPQPGDLDGISREVGKDVLARLRKSLKAIDAALRSGKGTEFDEFSALRRKQAVEAEIARLEADLLQATEEAARKAGGFANDRLGRSGVAISIDSSAISTASSDAAKMVRAVTQQMRADLNDAVTRAFTGELDRAGLDQAIRDAFDGDVLEHRVERIVRTEVGEVFGQQQARTDQRLASMGVDLIKRWVATGGKGGDGRTRQSHADIHGQERELDEPFNVGDGATAATPPGGVGHPAAAPLDPTLPAEERIQCRCTVVRVPRSQAKQGYISKKPPDRVEARAQATAGA